MKQYCHPRVISSTMVAIIMILLIAGGGIVGVMNQKLSVQRDKISELETEVANLRQQVSALKDIQSALDSEQSTLRNEFSNLQTHAESLQQRLDTAMIIHQSMVQECQNLEGNEEVISRLENQLLAQRSHNEEMKAFMHNQLDEFEMVDRSAIENGYGSFFQTMYRGRMTRANRKKKDDETLKLMEDKYILHDERDALQEKLFVCESRLTATTLLMKQYYESGQQRIEGLLKEKQELEKQVKYFKYMVESQRRSAHDRDMDSLLGSWNPQSKEDQILSQDPEGNNVSSPFPPVVRMPLTSMITG